MTPRPDAEPSPRRTRASARSIGSASKSALHVRGRATEPDGVQSVERALEILRILAFSNAAAGMRFTDLMHQAGLTKPTLHRLLKTLVDKGVVERDRDTRLYFLGFQFLAFGARAANRMDLQLLARPSLERLAKLTKDTVYLLVRSGSESVCLDREEGSYPVKVLTQVVGTRRPLGNNSAAIAMLAALPDDEVEDLLRRNRSRLREFPRADLAEMRMAIDWARTHGYAESLGGMLQGMYSVAATILGLDGRPLGALTVSAIVDRMAPPRRAQIAGWLKQEAVRITENLGASAVGLAPEPSPPAEIGS
jgi:DNA-binding IclR family transcriptional regulator